MSPKASDDKHIVWCKLVRANELARKRSGTVITAYAVCHKPVNIVLILLDSIGE